MGGWRAMGGMGGDGGTQVLVFGSIYQGAILVFFFVDTGRGANI